MNERSFLEREALKLLNKTEELNQVIVNRDERIAELESILRDIVADADNIRIDSYIPTINWASITRAKRLLKITPFDK